VLAKHTLHFFTLIRLAFASLFTIINVYKEIEKDYYIMTSLASSIRKHKLADAKKRGLDFSLSCDDINRLCQCQKCEYTGVKLTRINNDPTQFSLERVNNKLGYVAGNVIPVSKYANEVKNAVYEMTGTRKSVLEKMKDTRVAIKRVLNDKPRLESILKKYWNEEDVNVVLSTIERVK
jgi:hypothetical protein